MRTEAPNRQTADLGKAKSKLRERRRTMSLREKVQQVVELQKIHVAITRRRRPLNPLERVWLLRDR